MNGRSPYTEFKPGCRVRVKGGLFAGVEGFVSAKCGVSRSVVNLDLLQKGVTLEINDRRLEANGGAPHSAADVPDRGLPK